MATPRQIAANRRNALKSTGPKSESGKKRSRTNALIHGLAGDGAVLLEIDAAKLSERMSAWRADFDLRTRDDEWNFEQLVISSIQIEACQSEEFKHRAHTAARAEQAWDDDRRDEIEKLADAISRKPSRVAHQLLCSRQGCEWLIERWRGLERVLEARGEWGPEQISLAFDLLATPLELRVDHPGEPGESPRQLVARQLARLDARREALHNLDELRRAMASEGTDPVGNAELTRLRRYEAACIRRYETASKRLTRRPAGDTETAGSTGNSPSEPHPATPVAVAMAIAAEAPPPVAPEPTAPSSSEPPRPSRTASTLTNPAPIGLAERVAFMMAQDEPSITRRDRLAFRAAQRRAAKERKKQGRK